MANEEQRRAFASYMGTAGAANGSGQGQPIPQYPGSVANPGNPYLFNVYKYPSACFGPFHYAFAKANTLCSHTPQQFPGLGAPPTAPTPPPAAPSSVASYPGYQGGFPQAAFGQGGYGQGGYSQGGFPQRPPPLGQAEAHRGAPLTHPQAGPPGYIQVPRNYSAQPPPPPGYTAGWQHTDPSAELNRRRSGAPAGAMVPASRHPSGEIMESRSQQTNEQYHYQQYGQPQAPPGPQAPPPQIEEVSVPVMLCHTCSHCGRLRSAGFHRNNPVLPGKPLVPTSCRRCKKKMRHRGRSSFTRIRSCTADEPCDWPREPIRIDLDHRGRRSRRRDREEVHVAHHFPSRPRTIRRSSSQTNLGLRVLQQPPREVKTETRVRVSSLSPQRSSRYGEVWPPPDVVRIRPSQPDTVYPAPPEPLPSRTSRNEEVWPPPDVVRTHSYRKVERSPPPLRRVSSRIIELSPSPPPTRSRSTRVVYRSESQERQPRSRSLSPIRVNFREDRHNEDAEARITAHPRPYRPVLPDHRTLFRESEETSSNNDSIRRRPESPSRGILKPVAMDRETSHRRRTTMRDSQQSTFVEVGGPRVQFASDRRDDRPASEFRDRMSNANGRPSNGDNYEHYHEYSRHRYVDEPPPPPAPPTEAFERVRIRRSSLSPRRNDEEEIRIDRARRISPSPPPPRRYEDEIRIRHISPIPSRGRIPRPPPSPPSPERPPYSGYRHVSRTRAIERTRSLTPPPPRRKEQEKEQDLEDVTDSESAASGEVTEVRSWRGIDENGQPATFVEERRTVRMIEQDGERGSVGGEFRPMTERLASRSWRDV